MSEIITSKENPAVKHAARLLKSANSAARRKLFWLRESGCAGMRLTAA